MRYVESDKLVILGSGNVTTRTRTGLFRRRAEASTRGYYNTSSTFLLVYDVSDIRNLAYKDMDIEVITIHRDLSGTSCIFDKQTFYCGIMPVVGAETSLYNAGEYDADKQKAEIRG